ncbi:MAG: hypothetical protein Kilf2KO_10580 [Rhodospirillales bacterium]
MMKRLLFVALAALSTPAAAEDTPDLTGTWVKTAGQIIYWNGEINAFPHQYDVALILIHDQAGPVFKATQMTVAAADGQSGRHGTEPLSGEGHPILGTIGWDGRRVILADVDDTTVQECILVETNRMQCLVFEPGAHALAGRYTIEREE